MPEEIKDNEIIIQTIRKKYNNKIEAGIAYYTFVTAVNNIKLAPRLIQLLAFINYRGTISSSSARKDFCTMFGSSEATISNMVSELFPLKLLVKEKLKTKINPALRIDFDKQVVIKMFIDTEKPVEVIEVTEIIEEEVSNGD